MLTLACAACNDMLFTARWWPAPAAAPLVLALFLEGLGFALFCWATRRVAMFSRVGTFTAAAGVLVLSLFGFGLTLGMWGADVILLGAFAWSLFRERSHPAVVRAVRVAFITLGVLVGFVTALPSRRPVEKLVDTATYVVRFQVRDGWLIDELRRRPETRAALSPLLAERNDRAIALHATLGFPLEERAAACATFEPSKLPSMLREACPRPAQEPPSE